MRLLPKVLIAPLLTVIGLGGVAAALALGLRGHNILVLESAPKVCTYTYKYTERLTQDNSLWKLEPVSKSPQTC